MRRAKVWAWIGIAAQVVFTAYWLIAPAWQGPRYNPLTDSISDMYAVTAPGCGIMVAVLTVCGAATILFARFGLMPTLSAARWRGWLAALLLSLSIFGLGDLLSPFEQEACRLADPGCSSADQLANVGGKWDAVLSTAGIALLIVGGVFAFLAIRKAGSAPRTAITVLVLAIATTVALLLDGVGIAAIAGLLERVLALLGAATFVVLGAYVLRSGPAASATS